MSDLREQVAASQEFVDRDFSRRPRDRRRRSRARSWMPAHLHWRQLLRQKWLAWMQRRIPPARQVTLTQRSVFIFPSRAGFAFLGFAFILLLVAINFENSAVFALTFTLVGMFVISILHTFSNLSGLTITATHAEPAFAGQDALFHVRLSRRGARRYYGLHLYWPGNSAVSASLSSQRDCRLVLYYRTGARGVCRPGRLRIETNYPLGLLQAWSWIDLDTEVLVYPFPAAESNLPGAQMCANEQGQSEALGSDDFFGLRDYLAGDTLKSIAWKQYAKTGSLNTKQFIDPVDHRLWLDWAQTLADTAEARLEQLCYWALQAERGHNEYGLRLPGVEIPPGRNAAHLERVLTALALFDDGSVAQQMRARQQ